MSVDMNKVKRVLEGEILPVSFEEYTYAIRCMVKKVIDAGREEQERDDALELLRVTSYNISSLRQENNEDTNYEDEILYARAAVSVAFRDSDTMHRLWISKDAHDPIKYRWAEWEKEVAKSASRNFGDDNRKMDEYRGADKKMDLHEVEIPA